MPRSGAPAVVVDAALTEWQTSNRKGLYVRHAKRCGTRHGRRCSCEPSFRGKRRNPAERLNAYVARAAEHPGW